MLEEYIQIRTRVRRYCLLCGEPGTVLYDGLRDFVVGAPGSWRLKQCPAASCGLVWLDPFPLEEDLPVAYRTYYTHTEPTGESGGNGRVRDFFYQGYRVVNRLPGIITGLDSERRRLASMWLAGLRPGRLLDVGCGDGGFLHRMRNLGWAVEGLDFDRQAIENAKKKYGLELHHGDLRSVRFSDDSFDAITMNHVVEHVPDPLEVFAECRALLKPGGKLVIATPNNRSLGHKVFQLYWRGLEPPRHLHIFSAATLRECATRSNLKVVHAGSSAANADIIIGASYSIRDNPDHRLPGKPAPNLARTLRAMMFQYREHCLNRRSGELGEEAVLVCEKPLAA